MSSVLQTATPVLSVLFRLSCGAETASSRVCLTSPSSLFLSSPKRSRFCTYGKDPAQAVSDGDTTRTEVDMEREGSSSQKARRSRAPTFAPNERTETPSSLQGLRQHSRNLPIRRPTSGFSGPEAGTADGDPTKRLEPQPFADAGLKQSREHWQLQKVALKKKFGEQGWNPRKKLSPDTIEGIRALHEQYPEKYTTPALAEEFKVSPEAIRRILKSKWRPSSDKMEERRARWAKRHDRIWDSQAEMGLRPQRTKDRKPEGQEKSDDFIPLIPNIGP